MVFAPNNVSTDPQLFQASDPQILKAWSRVCAFAWVQTRNGYDVLKSLREDPKKTIIEINDGKYDADLDTSLEAV